jgi:SNF2 family DNA or RNA helicase
LTRATTAIWASPTYNLEHFIQGNHRIYRAGQTRKTETILVTAKGTIEHRVYQILTSKDRKQSDFLHMLQELAK